MQQNDVPVVKRLQLRNVSGEVVRDVEVLITGEPEFLQPWRVRIAELQPGELYRFSSVALDLSPSFLAGLTERVNGRLWIEAATGDGESLASEDSHDGPESGSHQEGFKRRRLLRRSERVELLARDEWGGLASLPEILAAFVLPNHPAVESVLSSAAELLGKWTGDPSLSGYQSRSPRRVFEMAAAIYGALQRLDLRYINPPASFEDRGQRIRLVGQVVESRMGTCIDLALLAASCLEQAGLHPLLVIIDGHAFTGVWLIEETFPIPTVDDGSRLRKRVDLNEILVFDPTCVTHRPITDFKSAVNIGRGWLDDVDRFRCVIDVRRARDGKIRPLPERVDRIATAGDGAVTESAEPLLPPPDLAGLSLDDISVENGNATATPGSIETKAARIERWARRLLDLSLRNRLLNFKDTRATLPLLVPDPARLEDMLAGGVTFEVHPRPYEFSQVDPRDPTAEQRRTGVSGLAELLGKELNAHRLHAATTDDETIRRLVEIYRAARLVLQESGANLLYLAIGFLKWYESETSEQPRLAPLVLIPVELHRKSARHGFSLEQGDDDPRFNVTLLELLKKDHGIEITGLDPLPEDESGLDLPRIFRTVRQAIKDVDRWEVVEDVYLGLFSFAKYLMWRDLTERTEDLTRNPVVGHLVNHPNEPFPTDGVNVPNPERLDDDFSPSDMFCPLPADSSQLAAVMAAAKGLSFVLEGPPGTGKSQTITNLIAHCLAQGKTVLFVSEKMAALDVVHRRLMAAGLGRFCLELHSDKAHKRSVLQQLAKSLDPLELPTPEDWAREARRVEALRTELNAYARALHTRRSTGDTVFRALSRIIGLRDVPRVPLRWDDADALTQNDVDELRDFVRRLETTARATGGVSVHPWAAATRDSWSPAWQADVEAAVDQLSAATTHLRERVDDAAWRVGLNAEDWSSEQLVAFSELSSLLLESPPAAPQLLLQPDWPAIQQEVAEWIRHGQRRDGVRSELRGEFRDEIARLDHAGLKRQLDEARQSWWPLSWLRERPVRNALATVSTSGKPPASDRLESILAKVSVLAREQAILETVSGRARELLGSYWNASEADWDAVARVLDWSGRIRSLALRLARDDFDRAFELRRNWARLTAEAREILSLNASVGRALKQFLDAWAEFGHSMQSLVEVVGLDVAREWGDPNSSDYLRRVEASTARWRDTANQLRHWCAWRNSRQEALARRLGPLVEALDADEFDAGMISRVFERSFSQWWLDEITAREPALRQFVSELHEDTIERFRRADDRYMELTSTVIQAKLGERLPSATSSVLPNSELGILTREIGKNRRQLPLRQLFQRIPNLLPRLKPCLLMSPMSVAQYLDPSMPLFDLVVFDEASQIPVWDAIGALGRARQAIIVGDPKQLPPTSFFQRADDDEEPPEDDLVEDLESILEECMGSRLPWLPLNWHYRSRHESLIAFSNYHYYDNRLLAFASPVREGMGVSWHFIEDGYYDKGKSRTNRREAEAIVAEIVRRLRDPDLSRYSIGVVTFNLPQQQLIEDLLDAARYEDPALDAFFAEDQHEPVFVKNLENVQGDERDVILFSICYGPDQFGKVSMNFGPMNRDGGERRLNVAVTRARREVHVYSTLRADQIDLTRTRAKGVEHLKEFLAYAEHGPAVLGRGATTGPDADFESPFEEAVYGALVARGWQIHKQVGCASYRIDLAVVDPRAPGRYVLGIECDGANYHRAKTARDRDKLREAVLRDLGWELHRIWSTDWWMDPAKEVEKVEAAIHAALGEGVRAGVQRGIAAEAGSSIEDPGKTAAGHETNAELAFDPASEEVSSRDDTEVYRPVELSPTGALPESFYDPLAARIVRAQIEAVVAGEGPISLELTARRIAAAWGFERTSSRFVQRVRQVAAKADILIEETSGGVFLWPQGLEPSAYTSFRVPDRDGTGERQASDLPLEEVANAAAHILDSHVSAPLDELVRETARLFGFQRLGRRVEERMREGVEALVQRGGARREGANIVRQVPGT